MSNALALSQYLPDLETRGPNAGDVVQVYAVPPAQVPVTQFAPAGAGGGGGATLPTATVPGQFMVSGTGPTFSPVWADGDGGRY